MFNSLCMIIDYHSLNNNCAYSLTQGYIDIHKVIITNLDNILFNPILNDIYLNKYLTSYSKFLYNSFIKYNKYHPIINDLRFFIKTQNLPKYINIFVDYFVNRSTFLSKTKSNIEFLQKYLLYTDNKGSGLVLFDIKDYKYLSIYQFFDIWLNNSFFVFNDLGNYVYYVPVDARMFWYHLVFYNNVYYNYYTYTDSGMVCFKDNYWQDLKLYLITVDYKRYLEYLYYNKIY